MRGAQRRVQTAGWYDGTPSRGSISLDGVLFFLLWRAHVQRCPMRRKLNDTSAGLPASGIDATAAVFGRRRGRHL